MTREEKIQDTIQYFITNHAEDQQDGTSFDCDVLDALVEVREKYEDDE